MNEAEHNLRELYRKLGGQFSDIEWIHNCINKVAIATLKDARTYLVAALDEHNSDAVDDAMRLIEQIDLLMVVSKERY